MSEEEIILEHIADHALHRLAQPLAVESDSPCVRACVRVCACVCGGLIQYGHITLSLCVFLCVGYAMLM